MNVRTVKALINPVRKNNLFKSPESGIPFPAPPWDFWIIWAGGGEGGEKKEERNKFEEK